MPSHQEPETPYIHGSTIPIALQSSQTRALSPPLFAGAIAPVAVETPSGGQMQVEHEPETPQLTAIVVQAENAVPQTPEPDTPLWAVGAPACKLS